MDPRIKAARELRAKLKELEKQQEKKEKEESLRKFANPPPKNVVSKPTQKSTSPVLLAALSRYSESHKSQSVQNNPEIKKRRQDYRPPQTIDAGFFNSEKNALPQHLKEALGQDENDVAFQTAIANSLKDTRPPGRTVLQRAQQQPIPRFLFRGIVNMGQQCYGNTLFNILAATPAFVDNVNNFVEVCDTMPGNVENTQLSKELQAIFNEMTVLETPTSRATPIDLTRYFSERSAMNSCKILRNSQNAFDGYERRERFTFRNPGDTMDVLYGVILPYFEWFKRVDLSPQDAQIYEIVKEAAAFIYEFFFPRNSYMSINVQRDTFYEAVNKQIIDEIQTNRSSQASSTFAHLNDNCNVVPIAVFDVSFNSLAIDFTTQRQLCAYWANTFKLYAVAFGSGAHYKCVVERLGQIYLLNDSRATPLGPCTGMNYARNAIFTDKYKRLILFFKKCT